MNLSVITVLYGGKSVLSKTLATWPSSTLDDVEFIVIDHSPEPLADVLNLRSWSRYFWNPNNPGFAAGVNHGCREATGDRILLLNPDVFLDEATLRQIRDFELDEMASIGLRTGSSVHCGIEYTWWGFCRDRTSLSRTLVGPSGGGALLRRETLDIVGPYPEHLFAWGEDAEWSLLARSAGVRCQHIPVVLEHVGGHTVSDLSGQRLKARLLARNRVATFRRTLSRPLQICLLVPFTMALVLNGFRKVRQGTGRAYFAGIRDGVRSNLPPMRHRRIGLQDWFAICGAES